MLWPTARRRLVANPQRRQRLAELRAQNPESVQWLALVEAVFAETDDAGVWERAVPTLAAGRPVRAPILHETQITVDARATGRWVRRLCELAGLRQHHVDPIALIEAAVCQDDARISELAEDGNGDTLRVVAQMAALPLLHACARSLHAQLPASWWEGYCPVCGAWPTLAEFRGLERKRWLRCGRCGSGWEVPWLRCPYCDETHHANLGYLAPEEGETSRKVEVCDRCKGYVKAEPTVRSLEPWEILLEDLATVPLEVAALDRGYHRPERPGFALSVKVGGGSGGWWRTA